jgi:NADPH:quinone reductase-like Zn-dependent oxidoreductase
MKRNIYRIDKAGSIDDLKLREDELPLPGDTEVTVEVKAIGLNFADIFAIQGLYKAAPKENFIPGLEYSGVIARTGQKVKNVKVGDRVMGITRFGAYVSHLNIDSRYVIPLNEDWTYDEGAGYLVQVLTAYYGLVHLGALEKGATVLIHSAAGGVGIWANRIAKKHGAYTIGTIGSQNKVELCQQEGYDDVIVRSDNFENDLKQKLNGRSLNLIMDCIGGEIFKIGFRLMAPQGRVVVYGSARYTTQGSKPNFFKLALIYWRRPKIDPQSIINFNKSIMGFNIVYLYEQADLMIKILKELDALKLDKPKIGHVFSFEKLHDAIYLFQSGKTMGKVVVTL